MSTKDSFGTRFRASNEPAKGRLPTVCRACLRTRSFSGDRQNNQCPKTVPNAPPHYYCSCANAACRYAFVTIIYNCERHLFCSVQAQELWQQGTTFIGKKMSSPLLGIAMVSQVCVPALCESLPCRPTCFDRGSWSGTCGGGGHRRGG